jgi:hypothetical protein
MQTFFEEVKAQFKLKNVYLNLEQHHYSVLDSKSGARILQTV